MLKLIPLYTLIAETIVTLVKVFKRKPRSTKRKKNESAAN
jgi:hypothetical protein